ncbi:MAG: ankyrin repeat domain-containing protein [Polyangia bacterium]
MSGKVDITVVRIHAKAGSFIFLVALFFLHGITSGHATTADGAAPASALTQAAAAGRLDAVRALLAGGAPVDSKAESDWTALHFAATGGWTNVAALLLDRGADPNARARFGMTPLHWAAMRGRAEVAGLLTRRGARTDARNAYGMTPLHMAGDDKVVAVLVTAGADVNVLDDRGRTPLHTARQGSVAKALIDRRADIRIRTPQGRTAMEIAAVDTTEKVGLAVQGPMLARLRGLIAQARVTLMNTSTRPMDDFVLSAHSPACSINVTPAQLPSLQPGELADFILTFVRSTDASEGQHPIFLSTSVAGTHLVDFDFRINNEKRAIPEDSGMIQLAKGSLRRAPSRLHYLAYLAVPLLVLAAWFVVLRKRRKSATELE